MPCLYVIFNNHHSRYLLSEGDNMFHTIRSQRCQRCGGNLYLDCDQYGVYISCIQCGAVYDKYTEPEIRNSNSGLPVTVLKEQIIKYILGS